MAGRYRIQYDYYKEPQDKKIKFIKTNFSKLVKEILSEVKSEISGAHKLKAEHILAIIYKESSGNPFATRYEPAYYKWLLGRITTDNFKYHRSAASRDTELTTRSTSYGLMQVMGQTARETGFEGTFVSELCDPEVGIYWGTLYLAKLVSKYDTIEEAIASYNAGSPRRNGAGEFVNQAYVDGVLEAVEFFSKDKTVQEV